MRNTCFAVVVAALSVLRGELFGQAPLNLQEVSTGLNQPLFVTAPAGDPRLFIVEKGGAIKVQQAPNAAPGVFLNLGGGAGGLNLVDATGEQGLLGLAFDPNFATNRRFYVNYINTNDDTVVARYTVPSAGSNTANTAGEIILTVDQPAGRANHKAGWIAFRPGDANNLYIATGDGGGQNDPDDHAENINSNLGKILRVDVSGAGPGFVNPPDNPFAGATPGSDQVWAYGLRNPFRNSFDRDTGHLYIADVGSGAREEVNIEETAADKGRFYGWDIREGTADNPGEGGTTDPANDTNPVFEYLRGSDFSPGTGGSITGGYVYRGDALPSLDGTYFFADFVAGEIGSFVYDPDANTVSSITHRTPELDPDGDLFGSNSISSFGEDGFGELYVVDIGGTVYKLVPEPAALGVVLPLAVLALRRRPR